MACVSDPACTANGTFCVGGDPRQVRACGTAAGGCRYSVLSSCADPKTCQGTPGQAACGCPPAGSGAGSACATLNAQACDAASRNAITCVSSGSCQVWAPSAGTTCTAQGLVCDASGGTPACVCDQAYSGTALYADQASGSAASDPVKPTGAPTPAACRFKSLASALTAASSGDTVKMAGWTGAEVKFSNASSGESFPLVVKAGVTLTTDDAAPNPDHYVVEVDQAAPAQPVLRLDHDAAASGFTVRPGGAGSASDAVLVNCAGPGTAPVGLTSLVLNGRGALAAGAIGDGLRLLGTCGVNASSLVVENAIGAGIRVETSTQMLAVPPAISIAGSTIQGNGDSGMVVNVDASNGAPSLSLTGSVITSNRATTAHTDTTVVPNVTRRGGGLVLLAAAPNPLLFTGNRVYGNSYDQVLVWSSDTTWTLSGLACDATSNLFKCYDTATGGGPWVGLSVLGGGTVSALNDAWVNGVPQSGLDYYKTPLSTVVTNLVCPGPFTCP